MKIILLQLCIFICSRAAVSDLETDLGSNVTINCALDEDEIYWIFLKTPDPPTVILRSFSYSTSPFYSNETFRKKYSVQLKHRLVINNVTADELGVYYCMDAVKEPKFSNSTRLEEYGKQTHTFITEQTQPTAQPTEHQNQTVVEFIDQNQTQWPIVSFISGLLIGFLVTFLIGLLKVFADRRSLETSRKLQTQVIQQHQEPGDLQYAEVDFTKIRRNIRSSQINSTYAALNLPKS